MVNSFSRNLIIEIDFFLQKFNNYAYLINILLSLGQVSDLVEFYHELAQICPVGVVKLANIWVK